MSQQTTDAEDLLFVDFEPLKSAVLSKDEMRILEELHSLVNKISLLVLKPQVEEMSSPLILKIVNSQTKINNILTHLYSIASNLKNDLENNEEETQLRINGFIDDLQGELGVFKSLVE